MTRRILLIVVVALALAGCAAKAAPTGIHKGVALYDGNGNLLPGQGGDVVYVSLAQSTGEPIKVPDAAVLAKAVTDHFENCHHSTSAIYAIGYTESSFLREQANTIDKCNAANKVLSDLLGPAAVEGSHYPW